jgi:hypothetical protein
MKNIIVASVIALSTLFNNTIFGMYLTKCKTIKKLQKTNYCKTENKKIVTLTEENTKLHQENQKLDQKKTSHDFLIKLQQIHDRHEDNEFMYDHPHDNPYGAYQYLKYQQDNLNKTE